LIDRLLIDWTMNIVFTMLLTTKCCLRLYENCHVTSSITRL